jgi:hypothetical protein
MSQGLDVHQVLSDCAGVSGCLCRGFWLGVQEVLAGCFWLGVQVHQDGYAGRVCRGLWLGVL